MIAYYDVGAGDLKFIKCGIPDCRPAQGNATNTITLIDDGGGNDVGQYSSLAIGSDGNPVISYYDLNAPALKFVRCGNSFCASGNTISTLDTSGTVGLYSQIAIGQDGNPLIAYRDSSAQSLKIIKCGTSSCNSGNITTTIEDPANAVGEYVSMALGVNGFPAVAYYDNTAQALKFVQCANVYCDNTGLRANVFSNSTTSSLLYLSDNEGYSQSSVDDELFDNVSGAGATLVYAFDSQNSNNTDEFTSSWTGQIDEQKQVSLQIYKFGSTNGWQTATTVPNPLVDSDFTVSASITDNLSDYYETGTNRIYSRVLMATTSASSHSSLKSDQVNFKFGKQTTMDSAYSQTFAVDSSARAIAPITISIGANQKATSSTDFRIKIPGNVDMEWDTTDNAASIGGNALAKVSGTVSFEDLNGDSKFETMKVDILSDFVSGDQVEIGGLNFKNFNSISGPGRLELYTGGAGDASIDSTDSKIKIITGGSGGGAEFPEGPGFQFPGGGASVGVSGGGIGSSEGPPPFQPPAAPPGGGESGGGTGDSGFNYPQMPFFASLLPAVVSLFSTILNFFKHLIT